MQANSSNPDGEKAVKLTGNRRDDYLVFVDRLLELSYGKIICKYSKNSERIAWIRASTGLLAVASALLRDSELEDIEARLALLEEKGLQSYRRGAS